MTLYNPVPSNENEANFPSKNSNPTSRKPHPLSPYNPTTFCISTCLLALALTCFAIGIRIGYNWSQDDRSIKQREDRLLDPQSLFGRIEEKDVMFEFPSGYEDISEKGDGIWNDLMPLGAGFIRVPHPRQYAMPRSKKIMGDEEEAEMYSVSMTHQLHCLAVLRHVIIKYEKGDKSRFAGAGHEYHCLDYIRQAIICAGDTTLDHAEIEYDTSGRERKYGFTGANATHKCRNWDSIKEILIEKRVDDKKGILF